MLSGAGTGTGTRTSAGAGAGVVRMVRDPVRYGFAVGRVRVLETRMLSSATYERLIDARDITSQRRILSETVYGGFLERANNAEGVERGLEAAVTELYESFLCRSHLPEEVVAYFRIRHDFDNLKGRLKAESLGVDVSGMLTRLGSKPPDVFTGSAELLSGPLRLAESRIRAAATGEDGALAPGRIDDMIDAELFSELGRIAKRVRNPFLNDLLALEADLANVRVILRARVRAAPAAYAEERLVPGGRIPVSALVAAHRLPLEDVARRLTSAGPLRGMDPEAVIDIERFDVAASALLARKVRTSRMFAIGPEPVLGYVMSRLAEVTAVRTLLLGSLAGVDRNALRARLQDVM
ncbi:MAG: V-type ATPase subunit [Clostridiales bacterium]|nr:V-type ATPase subunit [Clostridiales bacterium]